MNKKWIALSLKLLVSGGIIWWLLWSIDLGAAKERIFSATPEALFGAFVAFSLQVIIIVWRWQAVMKAMKTSLPFRETFVITYIGLFFNQALPSSVGGDAVRVYKTYKLGMLISRAINSVMLDRITTTLGLVLLVVLAVPFFNDRVGEAEGRWLIPAVSILAFGGIAGLTVLMYLDKLPTRLSHFRLVRGLAMLAADTRRVFLSPKNALVVIVISLIGHANVTFGVYMLAVSIDLGVSWLDCMVLVPPVLLMMIIPVSIAGWGVREGAMVAAFAMIGVSAEGALVLSIMFGLSAIFMTLPGGLLWLLSGDLKVQNVGEAAPVGATPGVQSENAP